MLMLSWSGFNCVCFSRLYSNFHHYCYITECLSQVCHSSIISSLCVYHRVCVINQQSANQLFTWLYMHHVSSHTTCFYSYCMDATHIPLYIHAKVCIYQSNMHYMHIHKYILYMYFSLTLLATLYVSLYYSIHHCLLFINVHSA